MSEVNLMKVRFYPVAEHYGRAAEAIHKQKGITESIWVSLLIYFCVIHIFLVPAILAYFGQYILAGVSFAITMAFSFAYTSFGKTNAWVDFYRQSFEKNPEQMEVELTEDGIRISCDDCSSIYRWNSIIETQNTDAAIYFLTKDCGIAVPKVAFTSSDQITSFLGFAEAKTGRQ
ncbi:MAG: hypothetical protein WBD27_18340 [Pyrinomonadaceae bacterium]